MDVIYDRHIGEFLAKPRQQMIAIVAVGKEKDVDSTRTDKIVNEACPVLYIEESRQIEHFRSNLLKHLPPGRIARIGRKDRNIVLGTIQSTHEIQIKQIRSAHDHMRKQE